MNTLYSASSITNSTRLYVTGSGSGSGLESGSGSRSRLQCEHFVFSIDLRDSRLNLSELYIPDGSGDTLTSRSGNCYGYLPNGHKASLVRIKTFIPYFETDLFMIDHHTGNVYLYDREHQSTELLAFQATNSPLLADAAKMLAQTAANAHHLALQNCTLSRSSSRTSSSASSRASRP